MKKLSYIVIAVIFIMTGCKEELLDLKNPNQYTEATYFTTADQCRQAVNAAYGGLYFNGFYTREWFFIFDFLGNEASAAPPCPGKLAVYSNYQFDGTNEYMNDLWHGFYRIVLRSNIAISKISEAEEVENEQLKSRLIAEAKYLRGWAYFKLATLWGDVPLRKTYEETKDEATHNTSRTPKSEVLDFAKSSIKEAMEVLPVSYESSNVGRVTKGAAQALLGKVYLYREKFDQAVSEFEKVENSGEYGLLDRYTHNFLAEYDNNKETIWSVQFAQTGGNPYWMFGGQEGWGGSASHTGRAMEYGWNDWGNTYFSEAAVEAYRYDSANIANNYIDPRASMTFYGNDQIGDTTYCDHCEEGPKDYPFESQGFRYKKYHNYEYKEQEGVPQSVINAVIIRYSDVLLMHAEALIRGNGSKAEAIDLINQVRNRVGAYPYDLAEEDETAIELLKRERRLEFAGEQHRFFDLVRWGELQETLNSEFPDNRVKPKHNLFPIPINERDINQAIEVENDWN